MNLTMLQEFLHQIGSTLKDPRCVNDPHSRLNATRVSQVLRPSSLLELQSEIRSLASANRPVALCGSRHSMGGQQFLSDEALLDMRGLNRVLALDTQRGTVTAEHFCGGGSRIILEAASKRDDGYVFLTDRNAQPINYMRNTFGNGMVGRSHACGGSFSVASIP